MQPAALIRDITARLAQVGIDAPRAEAGWLIQHVYDLNATELVLIGDLPDAGLFRLQALVERRVAREPLQYLLGTAPFRSLDLMVGPGVFIPRPETELLVDAVLPHLRTVDRPRAVDLCAGSGALALALADEVPGLCAVAVERSDAALPWLRRNVAGTGVEVVVGDVTDPTLLASLRGSVDAVVSNPPYVPAGAAVSPEVLADPAEAVFAGADGLALMPAVLARAAELLRPGGLVAIEHDDSHGSVLPAMLGSDGRWAQLGAHRDRTGRPRYVTARRR